MKLSERKVQVTETCNFDKKNRDVQSTILILILFSSLPTSNAHLVSESLTFEPDVNLTLTRHVSYSLSLSLSLSHIVVPTILCFCARTRRSRGHRIEQHRKHWCLVLDSVVFKCLFTMSPRFFRFRGSDLVGYKVGIIWIGASLP